MGKHKKDRESKKHKHKSRSRSKSPSKSKKHKRNKDKKRNHSKSRDPDVIEIADSPSPPPISSRKRAASPESPPVARKRPTLTEERPSRRRASPSPPQSSRRRSSPAPVAAASSNSNRSPSPIPDSGAGDVLSIAETNKLRAKLGLKPLEVGGEDKKASENDPERKRKEQEHGKMIKDDWGEFHHKPATNMLEKTEAEKLREKIAARREKRALEKKLAAAKTLGEEEEEDDLKQWVLRSREQERAKAEAAKRAKMLEEMDAEFGVGALVEQETRATRRQAYRGQDLRGLRVEHDIGEFSEGKEIVLTLKDKDVLDEEEGDTLVNVNLVDDERYKKSVANKKLNPNLYGYDVYEDAVDEFGQPVSKPLLAKYDEEIEGGKKSSFVLGEDLDEERRRRRKMLEIKAKLQNKRLESLDVAPLQLATDVFTETELATFKKPKKKVKKPKKKLKADDLLAISREETDPSRDLGSRRRVAVSDEVDDVPELKEDLSGVKIEDDDDLEQILSKARRLKQKEAIIQKPLPVNPLELVKKEIKREDSDEETGEAPYRDVGMVGSIILNETAEFCRTLGDIPTYGQAGNRDTDAADMMDFDDTTAADLANDEELEERRRGTWNSIDPDIELIEDSNGPPDLKEPAAILDEEPDVATGVGAALKLAMSKGYLEREENNRPSNSRFAHLQAQRYTIEDKTHGGEDDKHSRRDRYSGPLTDFKDKEGYKPNVKLEYIDDNGHVLNSKEAFRYLSHKFHGKGPGKNKADKRLKKIEQEVLMKQMNSTDTPLGTLTMLQQKQRETQSPYIVLSGSKQTHATSFVKQKM